MRREEPPRAGKILLRWASPAEGRYRGGYLFVIFLLLLTIPAGFAHAGAKGSSNVPLPAELVVLIPGPDVPAETAALVGAWEGKWSNGNTSILVIYQVEKDSARVFHSFAENSEYLPWHQWARASIVTGSRPRLAWKTDWADFSFELSEDGRVLSGTWLESSREGGRIRNTAAMTARNIERVGRDRLQSPFVCPEFGQELHLIEKEPNPARRQARADALVERVTKGGTPLVESSGRVNQVCTSFLYRGAGSEIAIAGHMNGWSEQKDFLSRVADTDLFYFCGEYPVDSRIEYKLVVGGKPILDPLNPRIQLFGKGSNSEALMPGYVFPKEIEPNPGTARGTVEDLAIGSSQDGMGRTATVYLPAGYANSRERYPVLYLNDAYGVLKFGRITTILDNLIGGKKIPPLIAVLLPSGKDRIGDYGMNSAFESFFVRDVVPLVDRRYRTRPSPEFRAVGGISAGATAALSVAIHHPDVFGKCIAQSTATKLVPLIDLARTGPSRPISVYLDVGRFEADFNGHDLVDASRRIRDALATHGCPVYYREVNDGHGWANWRSRSREALLFLFGREI
ncbi:Enterochelin esterase [Syntrophus gentianae]|uniref:Enterochelin esterase n=1 Tax=Syntrophus gentianae TaxID=43775 RepID=A0A1H8A965_9BACT|nr:alpha/beta hydrolase-fold protein [Syntrophus gentianae]SEM67335.1 Enterochelin esterase [Syntrophus gentianae]